MKAPVIPPESTRLNNKELSDPWKVPTPEGNSISGPFTPEELSAALRPLKPGKSPGLDSLFRSLYSTLGGSALKSWFCDFLTSCMRQLKIPKIWRRALIVPIPKPEKPLEDPKSYRLISLLCVPFKNHRETHLRLCRTNHQPTAPVGTWGLRPGRSTVDQVTLLTQDVEDSSSAMNEAGAVFVDLTAAYDTAWHRGLTCKLL